MPVPTKPLMALTAADLMTRDLVVLTENMPLRDAAALLLRNQVSGAPVTDTRGTCTGVLSAFDILRLAAERHGDVKPALPASCSFQTKGRTSTGEEVTVCTLPPGVCPVQVKRKGPDGEELSVCSEPHCVLADWQLVDVEKLPSDEVRRFMTADPVTVHSSAPIKVLSRMMIDAHIHRIIVVDEKRKPIGVVSTTDLLAAMAYSTS